MAYNVYFACDNCGDCIGWVNVTVNLSTAREIAREKGWQVGKKGWFCPDCRTVKRRTNEKINNR